MTHNDTLFQNKVRQIKSLGDAGDHFLLILAQISEPVSAGHFAYQVFWELDTGGWSMPSSEPVQTTFSY